MKLAYGIQLLLQTNWDIFGVQLGHFNRWLMTATKLFKIDQAVGHSYKTIVQRIHKVASPYFVFKFDKLTCNILRFSVFWIW